MEGIVLTLVAVLLLAIPIAMLVVPILLFGQLAQVKARMVRLESETASELARMRRELAMAREAFASLHARVERGVAAPAVAPVVAPAAEPVPQAAEVIANEAVQEVVAPVDRALEVMDPPAVPISATEPPATAEPGPEPVPAPPVVEPSSAAPAPTFLPPPAALEPELHAIAAKTTLEEQIGLVWFTRIGAAVLLLGVAYFFKYAVDNDWVGPLGRVTAGAVVGVALLAFAEVVRAKTKPVFANAVLGIGLAVLMFSAYASHAFYALVPSPAAIAAIAIISVLGGLFAVRYRAEAVLVLSTVAALSAPVLLSTGEDRPLALFSYTLVVGALAHVAAVTAQLRFAPWVSVVGTVALYLGWYAKFFDTSAGVSTRDAFTEAGAYHQLAARAVPLAAVVAFALQWLGVYAVTRARRLDRMAPLAYAVAALLFAHVGATTLLVDDATWLTVALVLLGALTHAVARREQKPWLVVVSLVTSGVALMAASPHAAKTPLPTMIALGVWATLHAGGLLTSGPRSPLVLTLTGVSAFVVVGAAALVLGPHHPDLFLCVLAAVSAGLVTLGATSNAPALTVVALAVSLPFVFVGAPRATSFDPTFIALAGAWATTYVAGSMSGVVLRKEPVTAVPIVTASVAGLAFVGLALAYTLPSQDLLRASLLGGVGAVDLALGMLVLRRGARRLATVLLGLALALFAGAVGVLFSGITVTLVWAAIATVVVVLAAKERDVLWLAGGYLLFFAVGGRLLAFDADVARHARQLWFSTDGAQGRVVLPFLLNERALAFAGAAAALFVSADACSKAKSREFGVTAGVLTVAGHLAALFVVLSEARSLAFTAPDFSRSTLDWGARWDAAVIQQAGWVGVATTLALGVYAAAVLSLGFGLRSALHRYLGLVLFTLALGKLGVSDIWDLPRVFQIGALVGTGALLLSASFLYARFGKRLVTLFKTGAAVGAFVVVAAGARRAEALTPVPTPFTHHAAVDADVGAGEVIALSVPPSWYRASQSGGTLGDLRVYDFAGAEAPYVRRGAGSSSSGVAPLRRELRMVDPVALADGSFRATFDAGTEPHDHVALRLTGDDFVRVTRVESSADGREWGVLAEGTRVYRLDRADAASSSDVVRYPTSQSRWLRVTLLAAKDDAKPTIVGATVGMTPVGGDDVEGWLTPGSVRPGADAHAHDVLIDLGQPGVPITALTLQVSTPLFERRVVVARSDDAGDVPLRWSVVAHGVLYRATGPKGASERLRVALPSAPRARHYRVTIDDGSDAPLAVSGAAAAYAKEELVVRPASSGPLEIRVGNSQLTAPTYDLSRTIDRAGLVASRMLVAGPLAKNPVVPPPPPPPPPFTDRYRTLLLSLLLLVLVGLALWAVRMLRATPRADE